MMTNYLVPYTRTTPSGTSRHALFVRNVTSPEQALAVIDLEVGRARSAIVYGREDPARTAVTFDAPTPCAAIDDAAAWMGEHAPEGELAVVEP